MIRTTAILCVFIVAMDAVLSVVSVSTGIPYGWFTIVQVLVYVAIGFVLRRRGASVGQALAAGAVTALAEGTMGLAVSDWIRHAATPPIIVLIIIVPFVIVFLTAFVAAGIGLASLGRGTRAR